MKTQTRITYILIILTVIIILWLLSLHNETDSRPQLIYNPKNGTVKLLEKNSILTDVVFEMQDTPYINNSLLLKEIGWRVYSINTDEIRNRTLILSFQCLQADNRKEFYDVFIDKGDWSKNRIFVYKSLPN